MATLQGVLSYFGMGFLRHGLNQTHDIFGDLD
jgi:hypothetical protein